MKQRDLSIDYAKGIAILFVYLGHSIIYHPIDLASMYGWCLVLERMIASFNLPMFFLISGLLFGFSKKPWQNVVLDKVKRLVIPYLFTMICVILSKMMLPSSMSYNNNEGGVFYNIFVEGGDRWFVYVLIWVFMIAIPLRKLVKSLWAWLIIAVPVWITISQIAPQIFLLDLTMKYIPFFFLGMLLSSNLNQLKVLLKKNILIILVLFVIFNLVIVTRLSRMPFVWDILLPIIGTALFMGLSVLMEGMVIKSGNNKLFDYISYSGQYSLQFYLFSFAYPLIRVAVVNVFHIDNPIAIIFLVFIGQLLAITAIIEATRRISFLKLPMGY